MTNKTCKLEEVTFFDVLILSTYTHQQ